MKRQFKSVMQMGVFALFLFAGTPAVLAQEGGFQMPPAQVQVVPVAHKMMAPMIEVSGSVISLNDSKLAAEVAGPITWIAKVGSHIEKGQPVARIDNHIHQANFARAEANLKRLEADMVFRQKDVTRYQELAKTDSTSRAKLDEVVARRDMLAQDIVDAKALLAIAADGLKKTEILAPFTGHMTARLMKVGEYVTVGKEVARFVETENLEVALAAPLAVLPFVPVGTTVGVKSGDLMMALPVRAVVPVGDQISRMVEVRLTLPDDKLIIGSPVTVALPKAVARDMVAIHRDAIMVRGGEFFTYVVTADNQAERRVLKLGEAVGNWISVLSGVEAGEATIVRGAERLQPGQKLVVSQHEANQ